MLYLDNDNDVRLTNLRLGSYPSETITDATLVMSLLEYNTVKITNVEGSNGDITLTVDAVPSTWKVGDTILIKHVLNRKFVNGFHVITGLTSTTVVVSIMIVDTTEFLAGTGEIYRVITPVDDAKEIDMVWDPDANAYVGTFPYTLDLIPKQKYVIYITEDFLHIEIEYKDTANVRTK